MSGILILMFLFFPLAIYTYTVTMGNSEQAIYILTNEVAALSWVALGILIYLSRTRQSPPTVRVWVYPLALSMKIFCGISAVRYVMNNIAIYYSLAQTIQAGVYIVNVLALAFAVGYASIYYKRIPEFLVKLNRDQALSRRFTVIADTAVDGFLETDEHGNIWYANRSAADIFGMLDEAGKPDPKLLLGRNLVDDFMEGKTQETFSAMRDMYSETRTAPIINRREPTKINLKRAGVGVFDAEITVAEYEVEVEKRFCVVVRDISYRVALEKSQKRVL